LDQQALKYASQCVGPITTTHWPSGDNFVTNTILSLQNVSVTFGALRAVDGVSLSVPAGQRRAIIGPNGAGKTTLFNAIAGVVTTSSGVVQFDGVDMTRFSTNKRAGLGISRTFQITNLFPQLSVQENIRLAVCGLSSRKFALFGSGQPKPAEKEAIDLALENSQLTGQRNTEVKTMSYGEQRQLEMAMALVQKPKLLLLDEPAAGLSPAERVKMADVINALPRDLTLILIEHDMDLALGLVDYVTCLHFGQVLTGGTPDEIRVDEKVQEVYLGKPRHA
jgi:branched-chain amino acid transport system ATP-binding protein